MDASLSREVGILQRGRGGVGCEYRPFSGVKDLLYVNNLPDVGKIVWLTLGWGSTESFQTDSTEATLDLRFRD